MDKKIEEIITLVNNFFKAYNSFDSDTIKEYTDQYFVYQNISHGEVLDFASTIDEFSLILEQSKAMFSKRDIVIENFHIDKNNITVKSILNATMAISTPDGLRAGQEISFKCDFHITIINNKITKFAQVS